MCVKAILRNSGTLKSLLDRFKNQEMCNKAVNKHPHTLELAPER